MHVDRRPDCRTPAAPALALATVLLLAGCGEGTRGGDRWAGTVDTLPNGLVQVTNPAEGVWDPGTAWQVVEQVRIGTMEGTGPDLFGQVRAVEVDREGRLWVLEAQAMEVRVFDGDGRHVRTIGRKGGGPGEFAEPIGLAWSPAGELWIPDPRNNRITILDTAGAFVRSHRMIGGFVVMPWPGGFDDRGYFYNIAPSRSASGFAMKFVRYDTALVALDTLSPPEWTGPRSSFEHVSADGRGRMMTDVPFSPGMDRKLTRAGDFWFVHTGPYELYHLNAAGDTVRKVTKAFTPVSVTEADKDAAIEGLEWFTKQGGKVDRSRIPGVKPAVRRLLVAEDGHLWVEPILADTADVGRVFEIFDPEGRYLGRVRLPFGPAWMPPVIRGDTFVAVTTDELDIPYVVRAKIVKPERAT
jgi:hypothetical protein